MYRSCFVVVLLAATLWAGCNEHPITPLERVITAVNRQENRLPAKTKIDFLFVIDDSGSMCEEQENLSRNFSAFSTFLNDELGAATDYRIAVTSTDFETENTGNANGMQTGPGSFLTGPRRMQMVDNCQNDISAEERAAQRERCRQLRDMGQLTPILRSDNIQSKQDLEDRFRCMATLGTGGSGFEKGLEAMRMALSCNGPNQAMFGDCCVPDQLDPTMRGKIFNPSCNLGLPPEVEFIEPEFLRPDALLVVIFVTDENDCSDPQANPSASRRAICKYRLVDQDGNGIPDGYNDPQLCPSRDAARCYRVDCGDLPPETCRTQRCEINTRSNYNCEWYRANLTPVGDYFRFLAGLKAQPLEQLVVATIVGQRGYTPQGFEVVFDYAADGQVMDGCQPVGDPSLPDNLDQVTSDMCCPEGRCRGQTYPSCSSANNGVAFAGTRYLTLADLFGANGIGCPEVLPETVTQQQRMACGNGEVLDAPCVCAQPENPGEEPCAGKCRPIRGEAGLACSQCVSICEDSFEAPLQAIKDKVAEVLATYCLDKAPRCVVNPEEGQRECQTEEELANSANYQIRVRRQCIQTPDNPDQCQTEELPRVLASNEWTLDLNQPDCPGGAHVRLLDPPQAGSEIFVEFFVQVSEPGAGASAGAGGGAAPAPGTDGGLPANPPEAMDASAGDSTP